MRYINQDRHHLALANQISNIFSPEALLPIISLIATYASGFGPVALWKWLIVITLANLVAPLIWLKWLEKIGIVIDDTLDNKELHRRRIIALSPLFIVILAELAIALAVGSPQPLTATLLAWVFIIIISGFVSIFWKISAHTTGIATFLTFLIIFFGEWGALGLFLIPLISWSRFTLHRHTFDQLVAGAFLAPIIVLVVFYGYKLIDLTFPLARLIN